MRAETRDGDVKLLLINRFRDSRLEAFRQKNYEFGFQRASRENHCCEKVDLELQNRGVKIIVKKYIMHQF